LVRRRVVVTGLGAVTPLGLNVAETWDGFVNGRNGIVPLTVIDASDLAVKHGGEVKGFSAAGKINPKDLRHMERGVQFAIVAAQEAVADAGLAWTEEESPRVGAIVGTAAGGVVRIIEQEKLRLSRGPDRVSPMFLPYFLPDTASGAIAIALGIQGPNMAISSACATGTHAIGEAFETIRRDDADVMLAGATEASLLEVILAGFINMKALGIRPEAPDRASRPFDRDRNGFVIGEGAGIVILEDLERARARGAPIYCEIVGYGSGNDAYHMVAPSELGVGASRVMRAALRKAGNLAGMPADEVDYINPHGSSTPLNDKFETWAIKDVFGEHARKQVITSSKSMVGHMFGAAGAVEGIVAIKAVETGIIPPTINYETPDPDCDLDYAPNEARERTVRASMSNSFGLGGHNATVIFRRFSG
jgi:3-oxoacyl-[acyl-carrier-protein] synthase II